MGRYVYYNRANTCDKCGDKLKKGFREYVYKEGERNWTGRWLCYKCWYSTDYSKRLDNQDNIIKSIANRRTGNLDPNSSSAKGDDFQELTCIWRSTFSTVIVEDLNKKLDNYQVPVDHSSDSELGVIQTKGRWYDPINMYWSVNLTNEHSSYRKGFKFDILIFYCANEDGDVIERIYIIPIKEIIKRSGFAVVKNPTRGVQWYEKYRIKDGKVLDEVNEIWRGIIVQ